VLARIACGADIFHFDFNGLTGVEFDFFGDFLASRCFLVKQQFAVVDDRVVFVPLLGFVDTFCRHKFISTTSEPECGQKIKPKQHNEDKTPILSDFLGSAVSPLQRASLLLF